MKHRAVVIGAGRIGAGYNWHDDAYTHAGAYRALKDRVELIGFVEPDYERAAAAHQKWNLPVYEDVPTGIMAMRPDVVSVCVQPEQQSRAIMSVPDEVKAIWCEKPYVTMFDHPAAIQVNYMRRGDPRHQEIAKRNNVGRDLIVYAKDDIHTRCHFEDLAKWWTVPLKYYPIAEGPCSYLLGSSVFSFEAFPIGGVDGGDCFKAMLGNLLDHVDKGVPLWSPAR